ncbi:MAG: hypothetical protein ACHP7N_02790 [Caulobacterales bacterium]
MTLDFAVAALAAIALMSVASFSPSVFTDGDTNWHVAAGRWIIEHGLVPATDPFSYTYAGKPWLAHEWLAEAAMTLAWYAAGWSGVVLLVGAAAGAAYAMIAAELRLWMGPVGQVIGLVLSFACLDAFLYARPHILALPLLIFWTRGLLAARRAGRAPPLALAPLMIVWANLHASYIFGLAIVGPFALEALIEAKDKVGPLRDWTIFGLASLAFALVTPHGIEGLIFPFMVLTMKILPNILEWRSATFDRPTLYEGALVATLFLGLWRGLRVPPLRLLLLVALTHMALQHIRQQAVLAALAPLLLAEPFGRSLQPDRQGPRLAQAIPWPDLRRWLPVPAIIAAVLALGVVGARLAWPVVRRDNANVPVSAMAHVPPEIARQHVFNEYAFGGYLIFKGVHPYIDGRADMYGDDFVREYLAIMEGVQPDAAQAFKRWGIRWTILSPRDELVRQLDNSPKWRRLYADDFAVVHVAVDPPPPPRPKAG